MQNASVPSKIALVTGGGRGIGRNTALALARRGVDVILTYRADRAAAESAVGEIEAAGRRAIALQLDTGDSAAFGAFVDAVRGALASLGASHLDSLINNAGNSLHASFAETTEAELDGVYDVHVKGVFFLTQRLLPLVADGGRIVMISSGLARFVIPGSVAYAMMKGAVETLTRHLAKELGPRRIAVNAVAPGAIQTDFSGGIVRDDPAVNKAVSDATAFGRPGFAGDVGPAIAWLVASDEARWIDAQRIEISGGQSI